MWYSVAGSLNSFFILLSLWGIWAQVKKIWERKAQQIQTGTATEILSLNQFSVSFLAYWSFFVYGYSIKPFNHFIVWPRLIAASLVLIVLFEIASDRKTRLSKWVAASACALLLAGVVMLVLGWQYADESKLISQALIVTMTCLLAQGYAHQIKLILVSGSTGVVSIRMSQFILAMDVSTLLFACTMGWQTVWPLLLLASVSAVTKLMMMYLFYWVRVSPAAEQQRIEKQVVIV